MKKKITRSKLVKKLDAIFSQYVRYFYSDTGKTVKCYTCWERKPIKKMQNWHFVSRANYKYRWDIDNCKPQCMACNIFKHWNYIQYTLNMIRDYGKERVEKIQNDKSLVKYKTFELEEMLEKYESLLAMYTNKEKQTLKKKKKSL